MGPSNTCSPLVEVRPKKSGTTMNLNVQWKSSPWICITQENWNRLPHVNKNPIWSIGKITVAIERVTFIEESPSRSWNLSMNSLMNLLNGNTRSIQFRPPCVVTNEEHTIIIAWTLVCNIGRIMMMQHLESLLYLTLRTCLHAWHSFMHGVSKVGAFATCFCFSTLFFTIFLRFNTRLCFDD